MSLASSTLAPPAPRRASFHISGETVLWLFLAVFVIVITILPLAYTIDTAFYQETPFGLSPRRSMAAISAYSSSSRVRGSSMKYSSERRPTTGTASASS